MTDSYDELVSIAKSLEQLAARGRQAEIREPLEQLKQAAEEAGKAWNGSWLGYHTPMCTTKAYAHHHQVLTLAKNGEIKNPSLGVHLGTGSNMNLQLSRQLSVNARGIPT